MNRFSDYVNLLMHTAQIYTGTLESFASPVDLIRPYLPGPLEGNMESLITIPPEIDESIQTQLSEKQLGPTSFIALVNSAFLFHIEANQAELAVSALKFGSHRLKNIEDKTQLVSILNGLAIVAAVTRSKLLADELRILVRKYRYDSQFSLPIEDVIKICLMSSACQIDLNNWGDYLGDWLTELAFGNLSDKEGIIFSSYLHYLLHIVPELWVSCGKAEAALQAFTAL